MFYDAFSQDFFLGHLPYPPFFDPGPAYNNIGPVSDFACGDHWHNFSRACRFTEHRAAASLECDVFAFKRNIKTPYMENYNLNIQQQISSKVMLQVGYVGSQGHRLFRFVDLNQPEQAAIAAYDSRSPQRVCVPNRKSYLYRAGDVCRCCPRGGPGCIRHIRCAARLRE